eukprot:17641_1
MLFWFTLTVFIDQTLCSCVNHEDCPSTSPFCYEVTGICTSCDECHYCHDGIDGTCGNCGDGYPLYGLPCVPEITMVQKGNSLMQKEHATFLSNA